MLTSHFIEKKQLFLQVLLRELQETHKVCMQLQTLDIQQIKFQ